MKRLFSIMPALFLFLGAYAQEPQDSIAAAQPKVISLDQAIRIALSENTSVKVADMDIEKSGYSRKGSYADLFPQVSGMGSYQRTIKKQVMYMDFDMSSLGMGDMPGGGASSGGGIEVGRWNTWSAGVNASMPLVNAQLWQSLKISDQDVELAVEKARSSRLNTVSEVQKAYYGCLLSKETFNVYKSVYENALENLEQTERKYNVQKASELDLARSKTALANAIPNVYNAENAIMIALWQLKAVMGVDLSENIDVAGCLEDYAEHMFYDIHQNDSVSLDRNSTLRQLEIQAAELANTVKLQKYACIPSLALSFSYSMNAMTNDFNFSQYQWSPYSYVGLSLNIPIFAGGKRYNNIRVAKVQSSELELQRRDTERQLRIAIRQSLNTMETSMKSYGSATSAVESAEKAYDIAQKSYNVGRSTLTDLNDAQLALTQARLTVSQAIYNFVVAKSALECTLGADFTKEENE